MFVDLKKARFWTCIMAIIGATSVYADQDKVKFKKNGDITIEGDVNAKTVVVSHDHLTVAGDPGNTQYRCRMGGTATGPHDENLCK